MNLLDLSIEVTRKCNLQCPYCLRGNPQRINVNTKDVDSFFRMNKIHYINTLTITGGEPLLNPNGINEILHIIERRQIQLGSFYMVSNGTINPTPILESFGKLYSRIGDFALCCIDLSIDNWHENEDRIHPVWNILNHGHRQIDRWDEALAEGHGKLFNPDGRKVKDNAIIYNSKGDIEEGMIYFNAKSQICLACDWSYDSQKKVNIGHALSKKLIDMVKDRGELNDDY